MGETEGWTLPDGTVPPPESALSIGEVAELTGLSTHALRWYEREGLLRRIPPRTTAGRRVFDADDVVWLSLTTRLRASGMPIATIRRFAALVRSGPGNERERLAILEEHAEDVAARMAELSESLGIIRHKVETYRKHLATEPIPTLWAPPATAHP